MKKIVNGPDGEKYEIEGTPSELQEYEELVKNEGLKQQPKKGKKRVLNERLDMTSACDCFSCGLMKAGWILTPPKTAEPVTSPDPFPFFPYFPPDIIVSPAVQPLIVGPNIVPSDGTGMPPYIKIWC